jgi:hypothetical protein
VIVNSVAQRVGLLSWDLHTNGYKQKELGLRSSETLRSVFLYLATDVSGQPTGPLFKGQAAQDDWADKLSRNVGN